MKVIGFIGASGTGKSYHALVVAHDHNIDCLIDDGLLIYQNRIIAGQSAKEEKNRMQAVRRAVFFAPDHAAAVRAALVQINPDRLLILGTSKHMICRICEALRLPQASQYIHIEDVSSAADIAKARDIRLKEGKHIIPVPTMELKSHFHGYLFDPIRSFLNGRNGRKDDIEQSVVRPVFSYYGKLVFSDDVLFALVRHTLAGISGIARVNRVKVAKNYLPESNNGLAVILTLTLYYGENIRQLLKQVSKRVQDDIEYTIGMSVDVMKITVHNVARRPDSHS